ncbi:hypothetical protein [Cryptosporangium aurantiacum]|uniref:Protein kinase domain-containing protein n=1 Tax=Cryptosporangium aurantiacum TaxID=134849 RepID=A0A1M7RLQ6_9ACTN|nr:hypothetical protein [Cryptosporangium aurantiacum]SHN47119.1 hypothetical protein SAMN05443668_12075 [Cryptosporangium aurantiacum]
MLTTGLGERVVADVLTLAPDLLGDGGQGLVYEVTAVHGRVLPNAVVYKEYRPEWRDRVDAGVLRDLVRFRRTAGSVTRQFLDERTAWPETVVERDGRAVGFLMQRVPAAFLRPLALPGTGQPCQVQHLLNDEDYLRRAGVEVDDLWRLAFLRDVAETLSVLHRFGVAVGDLSPLNVYPNLDGTPRCFFVDCDAMALRGRSVLPQAQTGGWAAPPGAALATEQSDAYKLALLAVRLFAGDQQTQDPAALSRASARLGALARTGLTADVGTRPAPVDWLQALTVISTEPGAGSATPLPNRSRAALGAGNVTRTAGRGTWRVARWIGSALWWVLRRVGRWIAAWRGWEVVRNALLAALVLSVLFLVGYAGVKFVGHLRANEAKEVAAILAKSEEDYGRMVALLPAEKWSCESGPRPTIGAGDDQLDVIDALTEVTKSRADLRRDVQELDLRWVADEDELTEQLSIAMTESYLADESFTEAARRWCPDPKRAKDARDRGHEHSTTANLAKDEVLRLWADIAPDHGLRVPENI